MQNEYENNFTGVGEIRGTKGSKDTGKLTESY